MTNFNLLTKILDENRLTGSNFVDWKRNLIIVLTAKKNAYVFKGDTPYLALQNGTEEQKEFFDKWHDLGPAYNMHYGSPHGQALGR